MARLATRDLRPGLRHDRHVRRRPGNEIRRPRAAERPTTRRSDAVSRELTGQTLADLLSSAWEDLSARSRTECPVCGEAMVATTAGEERLGLCQGCGSEIL